MEYLFSPTARAASLCVLATAALRCNLHDNGHAPRAQGTWAGQVVDSRDGAPIGEALVAAAGQHDLTDADGLFELLTEPEPPFTLTVKARGYKTMFAHSEPVPENAPVISLVARSCQPSCVLGQRCGDDGCGGVCGLCPLGDVCVAGACEQCLPRCAGRECGDDGCGGVCGLCSPGFACDAGGLCAATDMPEPEPSARTAPHGWRCDARLYAAGDGCDCLCGVPDPDCDSTPDLVFGCAPGAGCDAAGHCQSAQGVSIPDAWTCAPEQYAATDGCDCACGAYDPDCADNAAPLYNCEGVMSPACAWDGACRCVEDCADAVAFDRVDALTDPSPPPPDDGGAQTQRAARAGPLRVEANGTLHLAYWTHANVLRYARRTRSEWRHETVDATLWREGFGLVNAMEVLPSGEVLLLYQRLESNGVHLFLARRGPGVNAGWDFQWLRAKTVAPRAAHMAVDDGGAAHVAYVDGGTLLYARAEAQGIAPPSVVDTGVTACAVGLDANQGVHMAYVAEAAGAGATIPTLVYARSAGNTWHRETVDVTASAAIPRMALDGQRHVHVLYTGATSRGLWHAERGPVVWSTRLIDATYLGEADLRVDARGDLHVAYLGALPGKSPAAYTAWQAEVRYARHQGDGWAWQLLHEADAGVPHSLSVTLEPSGTLYLGLFDPLHQAYLVNSSNNPRGR